MDQAPRALEVMMQLFPVWGVPLVLVTAAVLLLTRVPGDERRKLLFPALIMPMFWIFAAAWGLYFFIEPNRGVQPGWVADWVGYPLLAAPILYVVACFVIAARLPESGPFFLPYSIANLYLVVIVSFISSMAVSGTWL
jgi:hypothetical protein